MVATIFLAFLLQYRLPDASNKYYSEREQYDTERHRLTIGQRKKYISFFSNVDDTTYLYRALVDLRDVEETHAKTMAYHWIGKYYVYRQSDSAYYYLLKARKLESNTAQKADIDFNLCLLNYDIEDYLQAEKYGLLCLRGAKNSGLNKMKSSASSLLGTIYVRIGDFTAAEKYFENALAFNTSNDVETNLLIFNNLGNLFEEKRNYRKAISFYKRGLSNRKLNLFPEIKARLEDNLGYSYFRLGDETGIKLLHQALKARLRLRNLPDILYSKQHIVDYLLKHDSIPQAIELAEQVLAQSRRHNLLSSEVNMLAVLVAYERVAGIYGKQYVDRERLLKNNRAILNTKLSRIEFETEELEKEHLKSERLIILIVTFAAVSILVLSIIIVLSRNKILNAKIAYKRAEEKHSDEIYNLILKSRQDKRKARIKEKQSIAMELHDSVMSRLSTVRLNLFSLNSELSISPAFVDTIE
ncbi:MAG: tetratricopeptide repeat protein, partial [Sphingobacteriales bacterium]